MDGFIGKDYEEGLASLKTLVEALPEADFGALDLSEVMVDAQSILYVRQTTASDAASISAGYANAYQQIIAYMAEQGLQQAAPPIGIESRGDGDTHVVDAAIPISAEPETVPEPIQFGRTPAGLAARAVHVGDYADLQTSVTALQAYIAARGKTASGPVWFVYLDDPVRVAPESLRTEIYQRME
jgi:effector-binding domain-containing protein